MTRIAHVTDGFLPRLGGIETHVDGLAGCQAAAGDDVHVLTTTPGRPAHSGSGPQVRRGSRAALRRVLATSGFDVVHVHLSVFSPLGMSLTSLACSLGLPVAVTLHSMWPDQHVLVRPASAGLRMRSRPVAWSAVSRSAAAPLRQALGPGVPVSVVSNAVDVDWWAGLGSASDRRQRGVAGEVVVTSLMRLTGRKRPVPLLRAMRDVVTTLGPDRPLRLVIAGDGPQLARVRRKAAAWGMAEQVHLPGRVTRQRARSLLQASDIYVAPADLEAFGIAALEARAVGLPVVAKRRGGVGEFVRDGTEGMLVDSDEELGQAVASLATDPDLRRRIAAHNAAVRPTTSWPRAVAENAELYRRAGELSERGVLLLPVEVTA